MLLELHSLSWFNTERSQRVMGRRQGGYEQVVGHGKGRRKSEFLLVR